MERKGEHEKSIIFAPASASLLLAPLINTRQNINLSLPLTGQGTAAKEYVMVCLVTDVSYGGVVLDGVFHVTDIILDYECSGGGGVNPDPGLPNGGGQFPQGGGQPHGGEDGGSPEGGQFPTVIVDKLPPPDCESFNYSRIGKTNWQCASVSGVHELFTVFNWKCTGYDRGIFTQPLYFQLPINGSYSLDSGSTKIELAEYLDMAFKAFDNWYKTNGCNAGAPALEQKLLEYFKDEFEENGGGVTLNTPLGFAGSPTAYKVTWYGYGNCD